MVTFVGTPKLFTDYVSEQPLATAGISKLIGASGAGGIVRSARQVFSVMDYGALGDNTTNDAAAITAAITAAKTAGGGIVYFPKPASRYKVNSTVSVDANGIHLIGEGKGVILDFAAATAGPGIALGGVFDWAIENFTVLNSYGHGIEIHNGTVTTGPQAYAAYGSMRNVAARGARVAADNIAIGGCYMSTFENVRSQDGVRYGIAIYGYCTSLTFISCHAFDAADDNWHIKNITYSNFISCGSDGSGGYGYSIEDAHIRMSGCGCETADYSAFEFVYTKGSTSIVPGLHVTIDGFNTINNNAGVHASVGYLATLLTGGTAGNASDVTAGYIEIRNYDDMGTPSGNAIEGAGAFSFQMDQKTQSVMSWGASPGFAWVGDGATDIAYPLPVNIAGANTRVATLQPKLRNGLSAYGGLIIVTASQSNRSAGSRTATYVLSVNKASAGTIGEIALISSIGNDAGANAADASFTWTFDSTNNELEATVVGLTATGNWYFHIACIGNISAVIG